MLIKFLSDCPFNEVDPQIICSRIPMVSLTEKFWSAPVRSQIHFHYYRVFGVVAVVVDIIRACRYHFLSYEPMCVTLRTYFLSSDRCGGAPLEAPEADSISLGSAPFHQSPLFSPIDPSTQTPMRSMGRLSRRQSSSGP